MTGRLPGLAIARSWRHDDQAALRGHVQAVAIPGDIAWPWPSDGQAWPNFVLELFFDVMFFVT